MVNIQVIMHLRCHWQTERDEAMPCRSAVHSCCCSNTMMREHVVVLEGKVALLRERLQMMAEALAAASAAAAANAAHSAAAAAEHGGAPSHGGEPRIHEAQQAAGDDGVAESRRRLHTEPS
jgi:ribosomal protein L12E/L44/L45/RPP1/RPP2